MRQIKRWWWVVLLVPVVAAAGFVGWAESGPKPMSEATAALSPPAGNDDVVATVEDWLIFEPAQRRPSTGLILYPGGRVEALAYGPPARAVAAEGYLVVLVPMPLDLAVLAPNRAAAVQNAFPSIAHWAVGGHSLGGAMAARYAHGHPSLVEGLVLWAAYPAEGNDLSERELDVVSIYGTRDGLATPDKIKASRSRLPEDTRWVPIEGGNHAQFGSYGSQTGDRSAAIGRRQQQGQVVEATVALLEELGP